MREPMHATPPPGLDDLLPPESARVAFFNSTLANLFQQHGYAPINTPAFEYEEVVSSALESLDSSELIRFIDPATGKVSLLRPDITPQIVRIVSTRMAERTPPWRLSYSGTVFRQPKRRARQARQIRQVGVEHIGPPHHDIDMELMELAVQACQVTGLEQFTVELSNPSIGRKHFEEACTHVEEDDLVRAMAQKDRYQLEQLLKSGGAPSTLRKQLIRLTELWGDTDVLARASRLFAKVPRAKKALSGLQRLSSRLEELGIDVCVDLGEVRGRSYYTGFRFQILAEGPGEAAGGGGRYDGLMPRFGLNQGGAGFAFDLGHLAWAAEREDATRAPIRLVCEDMRLAETLRSDHLHVAFHAGKTTKSDRRAYIEEWNYQGWLRPMHNKHQLLDTLGKTRLLTQVDTESVIRLLSRGETQ